MRVTDALLVLVFIAVLVDVWYTRKWLHASRLALEEMQRQARAVLGELGIENGHE